MCGDNHQEVVNQESGIPVDLFGLEQIINRSKSLIENIEYVLNREKLDCSSYESLLEAIRIARANVESAKILKEDISDYFDGLGDEEEDEEPMQESVGC